MTLNFISGNTVLAYEPTQQPVHSDANFHFPRCLFCLVACVPVVNMDMVNAPTELWSGTHTLTRDDHIEAGYDAKIHLLEGRYCLQPTIKKDARILRDFRLWHAGVAYKSETSL